MACDADFRLIKSAASVYEAVEKILYGCAMLQMHDGRTRTIDPACLLHESMHQQMSKHLCLQNLHG